MGMPKKHFDFNDIPNKAGVYYIYNIQNGKAYVGSSRDLRKRFNGHLNKLRKGCHRNQHLQRAWKKYGEEKFAFRVIKLVNEENLIKEEQFSIDLLESANRDKGYNIIPFADGHELSEETKQKISEAQRGRHPSKETRQKMSEAQQDRHHSKETREKMSEAHLGKHLSEETKQKISESSKRENLSEEALNNYSKANSGKNNPMYGKTGKDSPLYGRHHSEETRRKMSESSKRENLSAETRKKMSESGKRENLSAETRRKLSEAQRGKKNPMYGKHLSEETRQKISESKKKIHRRKLRDYDNKRGQSLLFPKIYSTF